MKDYRGVIYHAIPEITTREAISTIDDFLRDLSLAVGRIAAGKQPDSSGGPIGGPALDDFFFLPGRITPQHGFFGTAAGASTGFLSSTASLTKGKWFLNSAQSITVDEVNARFGVGTATPTAWGHFIGNPQPTSTSYVPNTDVTTIDTQWGRNSTDSPGGPPFGDREWKSVNVRDDSTGYIDRSSVNGTYPFVFGLALPGSAADTTSTVTGTAFTVIMRAKRLFSVAIVGHSVNLEVSDSAGNRYRTASVDGSTLTDSWTDYVLPTSLVGTGGVINTITITDVVSGASVGFFAVTYIEVQSGSGGGGDAVLIAQQQSGVSTTQPLQLWRDHTGLNVAFVDHAGMGQFQNVALEDPAIGTNTITHKAPTTPTTHNLIWPTVPISTALLTVSYTPPDGTLSWTLPGSLGTRFHNRWCANGRYRVDTSVDAAWIVPHAGTITKSILHRRQAGSSGTTTVVLKKNGTTVDTRNVTAASGNDATDTSGALAIAVAAGDRVTIDTTAIEAGNPADYDLLVEAN